MGTDQFAEAVSMVEGTWQTLIAAAHSEVRSCGNYDSELHNHKACRDAVGWAGFTVDSCLRRWPELSLQQARMILEGDVFLGMTVDQAAILAGVFRELPNRGSDDAAVRRYEACLRNCHGSDPTNLVFSNGRLVRIEHEDGRDSCDECMPTHSAT